MAKRQRSFFERLSELNDNFEDKNKKVNRKTKRNWINYGILGGLAAILIAGITIPLAINTTKINYVEAKKDKETAFKFENGASVSVKEFSDKLKKEEVSYSDKFNDIYRKIIFYMYEKEFLASKQYQEIFNNSLNSNENVNLSLELKSLEQIKDNQKKKIEDLKNNLRKSYGFSTWENVFKERLLSEEYGKSATEEKAIEYLTFKEVESAALRSLEIEIKTLDLSFIEKTAKKTIYKIDANGNQVKGANNEAQILFKQGEKVFPYFEKDVNYFVQENNPTKATVITTKSFIPELIKIDNVLLNYFNSQNILIPSSILLPGVISSDPRFSFSLKDSGAKQKFINNLKYSVSKTKDNNIQISKNISLLTSFKKSSEYGLFNGNEKLEDFKKEASNYETYLNALTLTKGDTLGFLGVSSASELIDNNIELAFGVVANNLLKNTDDFKSINLENLFKMPSGYNASAEAEIEKLLREAENIQKDSNINDINEKMNKVSAKLEEVNTLIDSYFNELNDEQFNKVIHDNYNKNLEITIENKKYNSLVYKVENKDDQLLVLTKSGISIFTNEKAETLDKFKEYLKNDLKNIAKGNKAFFSFDKKINSLKSKESLVINYLSNEQFINFILNQKDSNNELYTNESITKLKEEVESVKQGIELKNKINSYEKIDKFINEKVNSLSNINFKNVDGKVKVVYLGSDATSITTSDKTAFELSLDAFKEYLMKGAK
ncbi:putative membrane protein P80 [Mycoplasmopsis canis PG 14]|uniref:Membrane protein P80 n=1 Tax=Mycoplasmopsis canis TaxID=29555 RepID=A0A449ARU5_9BACT|nr:hypothetical protein [Mycoplasmopsis canis]AMD81578.1 hypothetical protein AXW82_03420 [Mycoplasmopsis canis PG 14]EIE39404.1 putative membrane protein P80 [Mycoplasmopsis canis PG 14]VEU69210.1 Uncharacterised protein [Mycoplasmopsis canis]